MSFNEGGHWYTRDGESCHEVPMKSDPDKMRNTTIKDARELQLVPSVTTILKVKHSPALVAWKQRKLIESAYNNRGSGLPLEQWGGMVAKKAFEIVGRAADEGEQYHMVVESIVRNEELPDYELSIPEEFYSGFCEWWDGMDIQCVDTEVPFAHPYGFGGRMDLVGTDKDEQDVFIDWKTRDTLGKTTLAYYRDSMPVQLAAYMEGYKKKLVLDNFLFVCNPRLISVVISRDEPGRVEHHEWPKDEHVNYWTAFLSLLEWWKYEKNYDPSWG